MHYANDEHRMHLTCEQYTAHATASGQGRNGKVVSDDDCGIELRLAMPRSLGGKGDGQNPEQLFAMGYSCKLFTSFAKICESMSSPTTAPISLLPWGTPVRGST